MVLYWFITMSMQTLTIDKKRYVLLSEREYQKLHRKAEDTAQHEAEDQADIALAERLLADPDQRPIPYEQVRAELGLD